MAENGRFPYGDLMRQPSHIQVTCSAVSAFNWLKLAGVPIDPQVGKKLVDRVMMTRIPLQTSDFQELAQEYGFRMKSYFPTEEHIHVDEMVNDISVILDQSPILQNISTHFSKKKGSIIPSLTASDMKDATGKLITHAVVVVKNSPSEILIVDPYNPSKPEKFDVARSDEKLRFLSWIMSSFYQYRLQGKRATKNNIIEIASQELSQPELVRKGSLNMFAFLQANIRYLTH
ncbi:hypothetical protein HZA76_02435 [Candidatus Roizmanbacteria bacterium]|nr:hypothetical protein [Candidatus Roizmanbacteria bacterium]